MIGSQFGLDHRLSELRPSERDHEIARQLRDAASNSRNVVRTTGSPATWRSLVRFGQPSRVAAG